MEKNEVWENIKKYAKVFFQGVGLFFAYVFHYIAVFAKFVYKHLKKLFKKLYRIILQTYPQSEKTYESR